VPNPSSFESTWAFSWIAGLLNKGEGFLGGGIGGVGDAPPGVRASSGSEAHRGLLEPHRDGPGLAMELYPDELRLDSLAVRWSERPQMENGLRYVIPGFVEVFVTFSASDSNSLIAVMVIIGGADGYSNEPDLSVSRFLTPEHLGGGEPICMGGGEGVWIINTGITIPPFGLESSSGRHIVGICSEVGGFWNKYYIN
jgi:hypothetical protein